MYHTNFKTVGINRTMNHQNNPNRNDRIINLLYSSSKSLSFSVKNNKDKHIHIQKMKNQNKSYFALKTKALIQTCWSRTARRSKTTVAIKKLSMN